MAVTQKAVAVAWGMGAGVTLTGAALIKANPLSSSLNRSSQMLEAPDQNGEARGLIFWNQVDEVEIEVYPSDTTLALAITAGGTVGLSPGDKVVVAATDDPDLAHNFIALKVGKTRKVDHFVIFNISLKRWPTDLSTSVVL